LPWAMDVWPVCWIAITKSKIPAKVPCVVGCREPLGRGKAQPRQGHRSGRCEHCSAEGCPLAQGVQTQVSSLVWDVAALERAFGRGLGIDGGYRKTDSVDPLTGVAEEALFDRSVMYDHHLPGQDFEQLGENIVQKLPSCCLVVRNLMDNGARLWYGAGGSHQPMAGAPQVDALALHDQVTDTQHFFCDAGAACAGYR
jgi:hypothetical protein